MVPTDDLFLHDPPKWNSRHLVAERKLDKLQFCLQKKVGFMKLMKLLKSNTVAGKRTFVIFKCIGLLFWLEFCLLRLQFTRQTRSTRPTRPTILTRPMTITRLTRPMRPTKNWAEKVVDRKWGDDTKKTMLLLKLAGLLPTAKNSSPIIYLSLPGVVQKNIESQLFGYMSSRIPAELWFEA